MHIFFDSFWPIHSTETKVLETRIYEQACLLKKLYGYTKMNLT